MAPAVTVRRAEVGDVPQMARVHVTCWQQTYRGLVPDSVLDDPGLLETRERFWTGALTDERWSRNRAAVAELGGTVVGIAMAGPAQETDATWDSELHLIYVDAAHHGSGAGPALLDAVLAPQESAAWWVADHNPRAHAFMRKHGFAPDGRSRTEDGVRAVRWVRRTSSVAG
ncbi:GNAT family N-acetyltransferase [Kineococcus arenarius]|uniref:GNAT family N-acetyltransferase n=1 Tax=Kineococcus sp. SYSU DK007 TaxID=3383128 RepID=UPI003D7E380C